MAAHGYESMSCISRVLYFLFVWFLFFLIRWGLLSYSPAQSNPEEEDQELLNHLLPPRSDQPHPRPSLTHFSHLFLKALGNGVSSALSVPLLGATMGLGNVLQLLA